MGRGRTELEGGGLFELGQALLEVVVLDLDLGEGDEQLLLLLLQALVSGLLLAQLVLQLRHLGPVDRRRRAARTRRLLGLVLLELLLELLHLDLLGLDVLLLLVELLLEPAQLVLEVLVTLDQPVGPLLPPLLFGLRLGSFCAYARVRVR